MFHVEQVVDMLRHSNEDIYIVGGSIRDMLMKRQIKDLDFVVSENPKKFIEKLENYFDKKAFLIDNERDTYRIALKDNFHIDINKMEGSNIEADLKKRDFTINAMAYDVKHGWPLNLDKLIDPFDGQCDIKRNLVTMIQPDIFTKDPIRLLRAVRLMSQLEFEVDGETQASMKEKAHLITSVSGERVISELFLILKEQRAYFYFNFMDKHIQLLDKLFADVIDMKDVGECKYHVVDSWTHSIYTVKMIENYIYANGFFEEHVRKAYEEHTSEVLAGERTRLQLMKLGALFHDIGKPSARHTDESGRVRFRGHEITGAEIVKKYSEIYKLSNREKNILYKYVLKHMWPLNLYKRNDVSAKALFEMFNETGSETLDILLIGLSDIVATRKLLDPEEEMGMFKIHIEYIANNYLTRYKELENLSSKISGEEIMICLGIEEGPKVGEVIQEIKKAIYFGKIPYEKEAILSYITKLNI
ncbi:HDIG domain-containing protein [Serpentinicella sp. ANB-PHB4]|uniref:CCA tRNA nucleotidyltransferase n=1 Tax=Serpentinicella sp. ANB-PHB4 TaxID=3074076 RepID=UPI00285C0B69|nr:HDIG domain-containing metalloprotein [Serpentinicella sp. ANB-PHB4]MDR5659214.1 HDIG domain-containing protein [Serpentinicella sp. ANB-PHB4]